MTLATWKNLLLLVAAVAGSGVAIISAAELAAQFKDSLPQRPQGGAVNLYGVRR